MACVVDDGHVGIAGLVGEIAQHPAHLGVAEIALLFDDVELRLAEQLGDGGRIILGVRELRGVLVGRVADHQRHALVGKGRTGGEDSKQ